MTGCFAHFFALESLSTVNTNPRESVLSEYNDSTDLDRALELLELMLEFLLRALELLDPALKLLERLLPRPLRESLPWSKRTWWDPRDFHLP